MPPRHDRNHTPNYEYKNENEVPIPPSLKEAIISLFSHQLAEILEVMLRMQNQCLFMLVNFKMFKT